MEIKAPEKSLLIGSLIKYSKELLELGQSGEIDLKSLKVQIDGAEVETIDLIKDRYTDKIEVSNSLGEMQQLLLASHKAAIVAEII